MTAVLSLTRPVPGAVVPRGCAHCGGAVQYRDDDTGRYFVCLACARLAVEYEARVPARRAA